MSQAKVIFSLEGTEIIIDCSNEEKMRDICQRYVTKIENNLESLLFLYGENPVNFELSFEDQANSQDKLTNEMKVLVFKKKDDGFICPKCGEKIELNTKIIDYLISSNKDIIDNIVGTNLIVEDILKDNSMNYLKARIKNIKVLLNSINEDIKKNNEILKSLIKEQININSNKEDNNDLINTNEFNDKNIIKGELDIDFNDIKNGVNLFQYFDNFGIDVYLNNSKVNMTQDLDDNWKIDHNFIKTGKYTFCIVFNETIEDMEGFFGNCPNLISLDLSNFDASNVTTMRIMLNECKKLKEIKGLDKLITSNLIDMEGMFQYCAEIESLDLSNFDTSNVTNMAFLFNNCNNLKEIKGLDQFKTNKVTDIKSMFQSCYQLEYIDLSNFDTSNVENMEYIFDDCHKLKGIKGLTKLNTSNVTTMEGMFQLCIGLKYVDLSNFDTSNVTNMSYMFNKCKKLKEIKGLDQFKTNNNTTLYAMFQFCTEIEYLDLSNFDTSNVTDMAFMFSQCNKIKEIKGINNFVTSKVMYMETMFNECRELEYLDLSNFDTSNVDSMSLMFNRCNKLKYLNLLNFTSNAENKNMLTFQSKNNCEFITNNPDLIKLFNSS